MEQIIIIGKGGHARSIVDAIECEGKYQIAGYVINEEEIEEENNDYPVIGKDENLQELYSKGIHYAAIGIGYLGKGSLRRKLYEKLKQVGYSIPIICDPSAIISAKTKIKTRPKRGIFISGFLYFLNLFHLLILMLFRMLLLLFSLRFLMQVWQTCLAQLLQAYQVVHKIVPIVQTILLLVHMQPFVQL